jgi:hypothetical protein
MSCNIRYGANLRVIGKISADKLSHAMAFKPITGTLSDLAAHIGKGHPWMPAVLDGNRHRWQSNANHAEILGADIDDGMSLEQAIAHPFISAHCGLIIESASSKPTHHKFRLVFKLAEPVKGWQNVRLCNRYLISILGVADPSCKDASRFFFGAPGRVPFWLNESVTLPESFVADAIAWHEGIEREEQRRAELARQQWQQWRDENPAQDSDALVLKALDYIDPNCDYNQWIAVGMSLAGMGDHWFAHWDGWSSRASSYKRSLAKVAN